MRLTERLNEDNDIKLNTKTIRGSENLYTIVGHQFDGSTRGYRNRYAGVNTRGGACVLTMGERRMQTSRAYFETEEEAKNFFDIFVAKFSYKKDIEWKITKVSKTNYVSTGSKLVLDDSDCGPYYHVTEDFFYYAGIGVKKEIVPPHGLRPDSKGNVSYERGRK